MDDIRQFIKDAILKGMNVPKDYFTNEKYRDPKYTIHINARRHGKVVAAEILFREREAIAKAKIPAVIIVAPNLKYARLDINETWIMRCNRYELKAVELLIEKIQQDIFKKHGAKKVDRWKDQWDNRNTVMQFEWI